MGSSRGELTPDGCDCCGRDAEDCGMLDAGWVADRQLLAAGGTFCLACAHLLRIARLDERCTWCEEPMVEEARADALGWGYFTDRLGDLHPCCPSCLAGRFGITGRLGLIGRSDLSG